MVGQVQFPASISLQEDSQSFQPTRGHHSELQPLKTMQIYSSRQEEVMSTHRQLIPSPIPTLLLGSPTFFATKQYLQENNSTFQEVSSILSHAQIPMEDDQQIPRRHSDHSSLARQSDRQLRKPSVASFSDSTRYPRSASTSLTLAEESQRQLLSGVDQGEISRLRSIVAKSWPTDHGRLISQTRERVPFEYMHNKLRRWGLTYLGNSATADAFVRARHRRYSTSGDTDFSKEKSDLSPQSSLVENPVKERFSMAMLSEVASQLSSLKTTEQPLPTSPSPKLDTSHSNLITIRARVIPQSIERKPFLIQRQFDVKEVRDNLPLLPKGNTTQSQGNPRELFRGNQRSQSLSARGRATATANVRAKAEERAGKMPHSQEGMMPIHIEYALHHLPILAALMLSGHVRKGDNIDLPLPHPEVWEQVVAYVYTGEGELSGAMREDIEFLGGRC